SDRTVWEAISSISAGVAALWQTAQGQIAQGQTAQGQTAQGQTAQGQTTQGQTTQGQTTQGQTAQGQKDFQVAAVGILDAKSESGDAKSGSEGAKSDREEAKNESGNDPKTAGKTVPLATEQARLMPYIHTLMGNLKVSDVRETRLLKIAFTHTDPEIAGLVSNGIARNFIEHNFQSKTQRFDDASTWLEDSTRKLKDRVEQAEQKLASYSRQHNILPLEGGDNLTAGKLVGLHGQVMRAETDRILKQSLYEEVKQGRVSQLPEAFADPKTAELRSTLNQLAVTASQLSVKFGAKHPRSVEVQKQMATIQEQIGSNRTTLEEKLKADYERAVRDEESLKAALSRAKTEAVQQNQSAIQYSILQQDLATAKSLWTEFLNKTSQANIQRAEQFNNVRLIEAAEPRGLLVGPNRTTPILIGLILTLALGVGLAWVLEKLNTTVKSVEDVNRSIQSPVLAVIPTLSQDSLSVIRTGLHHLKDGSDSTQQAMDQPTNSVSPTMLADFTAADEAYRMLRTSVLLSTAGRPPRTIMVTSGQPGEGKTTTVINTAIAFTQLKAEVLIIDCDMRRPMIHKLARIDKQKGLSTFLSGSGDIAEFIKRTPIPYLSILPSGPTPPNPSELISSESMKEMLNVLLDRYKYILIDSPPLIAVADPMILSTIVDGVILVARSGKSKSEALRRASQHLSSVRAKVLGVILNNLNVRRENYEYYYSANYHTDSSDQVTGGSAGD
ncbi:MAG: polysaccharide biosynthesis tyrosine autokinase, partial [Acidobacteria bacterium]|nr:polysaccharide biosynthesis tyrosine autokinase [Acidobacteriota bacterium]